MCRAPLKISLLSGLPVEILQLQSVVYNKLQAAITLTPSNTQYSDVCNSAANVHEYVLSYIVMAA